MNTKGTYGNKPQDEKTLLQIIDEQSIDILRLQEKIEELKKAREIKVHVSFDLPADKLTLWAEEAVASVPPSIKYPVSGGRFWDRQAVEYILANFVKQALDVKHKE